MLIEKTYSVSGIVQGVGFRPLCVRIAHRTGIRGSVANTSDGVLLRLQGTEDAIARYVAELKRDCPDVALIADLKLLERKDVEQADDDFTILKSVRSLRQRVLLPPDMATCRDCLADIRDPAGRRYRYAFTNCTNCGPRFSIVRELPYDRPKTTMSAFPMCPACRHEYADETNRRFHAQPNACPVCGPRLTYCDARGKEIAQDEKALALAIAALANGQIIAVKGLGGFHLACDATREEPVSLLRRRKRRPRRPFAVMVKNVVVAEKIVKLSAADTKLLTGARAPIILLERNDSNFLAPSVAPGLNRLGVMLPYTPLHHMIMEEFDALVMTSANLSGEPLVSENEEAHRRLAGICDGFLVHNRPIHMKIDDSVLLHHDDGPVLIRRARGYVPNPIIAARELAPVLAAGAEMKATFSFSQDAMIFPSQYLGDMKDMGTVQFYEKALRHFLALYNFAPERLVTDLHPLYLSTAAAKRAFPQLPALAVQHHYAHMMACLAENRVDSPALGIIMDGTGYGGDGSIWGGEILCGDAKSFERCGHLKEFRLPGGDRAVMEPWRCGLSLLVESCGVSLALELCQILWPGRTAAARQLLNAWKAFPLTSSCGRLFDGLAAIVLRKESVSYDGEAAMELQALAETHPLPASGSPFDVENNVIDWRPFVAALARTRHDVLFAAGAFHSRLAQALAQCAANVAGQTGIRLAALSGGCWQNGLLLKETLPLLRARGLTPLTHKRLSPNDECLSVGQAYIGGLRRNEG